jgi:hypothetical protein
MVNNFGGIPPAFGFDKPLPVGEGGTYVPKGTDVADINPQGPTPIEKPPENEDVYRPTGEPVGEGGSYVPKRDDVAGIKDKVDINKDLFK